MRDSDCTSGTRDEPRYWTGYCRGCIVSGGGNGVAEPGIRSVNTALCLQTPDLALARARLCVRHISTYSQPVVADTLRESGSLTSSFGCHHVTFAP